MVSTNKKFYEIKVQLKTKISRFRLNDIMGFLSEEGERDFFDTAYVNTVGRKIHFVVYTSISELPTYVMFFQFFKLKSSIRTKNVTDGILKGSYDETFFWDMIENKNGNSIINFFNNNLDTILSQITNLKNIEEKVKRLGKSVLLPCEKKIYSNTN